MTGVEKWAGPAGTSPFSELRDGLRFSNFSQAALRSASFHDITEPVCRRPLR